MQSPAGANPATLASSAVEKTRVQFRQFALGQLDT